MGEAQMLAEMHIEWGSSEHFHKIDEVMESISYYAIKASSDLAIEKGCYPLYENSDWLCPACKLELRYRKREMTELGLKW